MIRIAHIGDTHLHAAHARGADRLRWLDYVIDQAIDRGVHVWLWPGDIFHGRSSVQDRNDLAARLERMASYAPVILAYGNHEAPGDLDVFAKIRAQFPVHVVDTPRLVLVTGIADWAPVAIVAIPYPSRGGLIAAGAAKDETLQVGNEALEEIFQALSAELADFARDGWIPIVMGHLNVVGAVSSSGQPQVGREIEIAPSALVRHFACARYIGLNHIHRAQVLEEERIRYAGSTCRLDWGEREIKSTPFVTLMETPGGDVVELIEIPVPPMFHIDGEFCRGGDGFALSAACSADEEIKRRFLTGDWDGCEVRVRFSFPASERALVDESLIRASFPGALRLDLEPVAVPDRALRAPEVATARTLAEKVDAWARLDGGRAVPASVLQKLAALETGDPTSVLSGVANQVSALENGQKVEAAA